MLLHDHESEYEPTCIACVEQSITSDMTTDEHADYIINKLVNNFNMEHRTPNQNEQPN